MSNPLDSFRVKVPVSVYANHSKSIHPDNAQFLVCFYCSRCEIGNQIFWSPGRSHQNKFECKTRKLACTSCGKQYTLENKLCLFNLFEETEND